MGGGVGLVWKCGKKCIHTNTAPTNAPRNSAKHKAGTSFQSMFPAIALPSTSPGLKWSLMGAKAATLMPRAAPNARATHANPIACPLVLGRRLFATADRDKNVKSAVPMHSAAKRSPRLYRPTYPIASHPHVLVSPPLSHVPRPSCLLPFLPPGPQEGVDARAPAAIRCYGFPSREHGPGLIGRGTGWNPDRVPMKRDGEPSIPNRIGELLGRVVGAVVVQDRCWRASSSVHRHGLLRDSCRRMQERTVFLPDVEEFQDHGGVPIATRPSSGRRSASNDGCTGVARLFVQPSADRRRH
eukprot:scaffold324_cov326-Pavlova_lutheri.AAC.61